MALKGTPQVALRVDLGEEEPRARQRGERGEDAPRARGAVARLVRYVVIVVLVRAAVALHRDAAERRLPAVRQFFVRALVDVGVARARKALRDIGAAADRHVRPLISLAVRIHVVPEFLADLGLRAVPGALAPPVV